MVTTVASHEITMYIVDSFQPGIYPTTLERSSKQGSARPIQNQKRQADAAGRAAGKMQCEMK
jgi:hypothetical protein